MVRFVESEELGVPPKRKQVSNACDPCRKRKKRCFHHPGKNEEGRQCSDSSAETRIRVSTTSSSRRPVASIASSTATNSILQLDSPSLPTTTLPSSSLSSVTPPIPTTPSLNQNSDSPNGDDTLKARFVGDTNPEGLLVEAVSPRSKRDSSHCGGVGIWVSQPTSSHLPAMTLAHRGLESVILPYVFEICLKVVPPGPDYAALRSIYLEKIHPLFPVFDDASLNTTDDSPDAVLTRQVISLAAGTDGDAGPYLRFQSDSAALSHAEFSTTLTSAIRAIIDSAIVTDRLVLSRCLSLLSLYIQPPTSEETDLPTLTGAKAIHHGQTIAIQIEGKADERDGDMERLFLCTWVLDRLNGAFYGRPLIWNEKDFGRNLEEAILRQQPPFRLFLTLIKLLDGVIALYRPGAPNCDFFDLGALEELIIRAGAARINPTLLATMETFYNAIVILSCRVPSPGREGRGVVPIPAASCRRSLAAERISFVVGREYEGRLSPLPIVPYSVSLALSVAYRKMRYTRVPMYWTRAKAAFAANCALLHSLGDIFWSARVLSTLGDRVLLEMEKAVSSILLEQGEGYSGVAVCQQQPARLDVQPKGNNATAIVPPHVPDSTSNGSGTWDSKTNFFDNLPDMDLFGHLDPGFNLDAVDAALEANLDMGQQVNWTGWGDLSAYLVP